MQHSSLTSIIHDMRMMAAHLAQRSEYAGLQTDEIKQIERQLQLLLLYKSGNFDFVDQIAHGNTLLVGEGNLSFALSLTGMDGINPARLTATTFEHESKLSPASQANGRQLRLMGVGVIYGVDATRLATTFGRAWLFHNIIFQFPNVGSREPVEGHNPNFILIRDFLISAEGQLERNGQVLISAVNSPHYQGAFQFEEAASIAGFLPPEVYPFDPDQFLGYEHTMTHQEGDALGNHDKLSTWVFRLA